jgi:hypothetical protein
MTSMTDERRAAANKGFASGWVKCKLGALCFYSSSELADNLALRYRKLYIVANR